MKWFWLFLLAGCLLGAVMWFRSGDPVQPAAATPTPAAKSGLPIMPESMGSDLPSGGPLSGGVSPKEDNRNLPAPRENDPYNPPPVTPPQNGQYTPPIYSPPPFENPPNNFEPPVYDANPPPPPQEYQEPEPFYPDQNYEVPPPPPIDSFPPPEEPR